MSLNKLDSGIESKKNAMETIPQKPKAMGGAEAAMAASEELAQLCSMLVHFEDVEVPKKKVTWKLTGAEAAMAASEELAQLCSMLEFDF